MNHLGLAQDPTLCFCPSVFFHPWPGLLIPIGAAPGERPMCCRRGSPSRSSEKSKLQNVYSVSRVTHAHTHSCLHTQTSTRVRAHMHTHACTHIHACIRAHMCACKQAHVQAHTGYTSGVHVSACEGVAECLAGTQRTDTSSCLGRTPAWGRGLRKCSRGI